MMPFPPARSGSRLILLVLIAAAARGLAADTVSTYRAEIEPILAATCFDCHADGMAEGNRAFDAKPAEELVRDNAFWWAVLRNVRAGLMPPPDTYELEDADRQKLVDWIKSAVFQINPAAPDPGRRVPRRLNRVEYENTIADLLGVEINAAIELPADDSGKGFDNVADALMISPLLVEKYFKIASEVVDRAIEKDKKRFFPQDEVPAEEDAQRDYARSILTQFTTRAYRRPPGEATIERLVNLAEAQYSHEDCTFERGVARAMSAVLASPRFLFRIDEPEPQTESNAWPAIDEYSLASRLSYLLWSSMPDEELLTLAAEQRLRQEMPAQLERMLEDKRSQAFVENFAGQWLRSRDVEHISLDAVAVSGRADEFFRLRRQFRRLRDKEGDNSEELRELREKFEELRQLREYFGVDLRKSLRRETEMHFGHIVRKDRSLLELIDADYAFLNERLAKHYGVPGVEGRKMRKVTLPPDSPRGGVLTQGAMLAVTSNPSRTSPVKRGLYVLENLLGSPPPPPPADVPELEDAAAALADQNPTLRELLAAHRDNPGCAACHERMDPLGLALENFNAMGAWRDMENGKPIDPAGQLVSGESFAGVVELKKLLVTTRRADFYRCVTEKLLTYALGRELEYYDEHTADVIVADLEENGGRFSVLLRGVIDSAPFQRMRADVPAEDHTRDLSSLQ